MVTVVALVAAVTPIGKIAGAAELSNVLLYMVIALLASCASLLELTEAPVMDHFRLYDSRNTGIILVALAKIFKLDMFTCGVASLANIGGTASRAHPGRLVFRRAGAGRRSDGADGLCHRNGGGILTANIMKFFA